MIDPGMKSWFIGIEVMIETEWRNDWSGDELLIDRDWKGLKVMIYPGMKS